jgi:predicted nucleic acid-binding protein
VKRVFVDTGGFFALLVADDRNHEHAVELFRQGSREGWRLVTTNAVVTETYARRHRDKTYSLCDALSFAVMQRLGVRHAIAFDRHFREYGKFTLL